MAYFSNGSEGDCYEEKFCDRCVHQPSDPAEGCPVWLLHHRWNYEQLASAAANLIKREALNALWPRGEQGQNLDCAMFVERPAGEGGDDG